MSASAPIEVRSYRTVFDLERRIYRIDSLRLNPGGVPLRGVLYGGLLLLASLLLQRLPLMGPAFSLLPWYLRDLGLPAAGAALLGVVRVEGRPFHQAAWALLRFAAGPRELCGLRRYRSPGRYRRWHPPELLLLADGSAPGLRRLRFTGPGTVLITVAHASVARRATRGLMRLAVHQLPGDRRLSRERVLELGRGVRVDFHRASLPGAGPGLAGGARTVRGDRLRLIRRSRVARARGTRGA